MNTAAGSGTTPPEGGIDRPIFIAGRSVDLATGKSRMVVVWADIDYSRWVACEVSRAVVSDARSIVGLAAHGAPVSSGNRHAVVAFLVVWQLFTP